MSDLLARLRAALDAPGPDRRLQTFLWIFAVYLFIRGFAYRNAEPSFAPLMVFSLLLPFSATRRWGALLALILEAAIVRRHAPLMSNHGFLEIWTLLLLALVAAPAHSRAARAALARALMAGLFLLVFWSGVQKVLHGHYPAGEYFAAELSRPGKFADRLSWMLPAGDLSAITTSREEVWRWAQNATPNSLSPELARPASLMLLSRLMSWSTLVAELGLPFLLVWRRTRLLALALIAGFFVGVEAAADEWHFGLLVLGLLTLFLPEEGLLERLRRRGSAAPAGPPPREETAADDAGVQAPERARSPTLGFVAIVALVSLIALWPAAHFALTRTTGLNPWKLGGFAMYAVPGRFDLSRIEVRGPGGAPWRPYVKPASGDQRIAIEAEENALANTPFEPFASAAVRRIAALVRGSTGGVAAVRVRSRVVVYDLDVGRFRLVERRFEEPAR